jgi:hypothetical protein
MIERVMSWLAFIGCTLGPAAVYCSPQALAAQPAPFCGSMPEWRSVPAAAASATGAVQSFDVNVVEAEIEHAMAANPNLHGAWLFFTFNDPDPGVTQGTFTFWRVLDASRAEPQKQELARFISKWVPGGNYRIDEKRDRYFPFSRLLTELRDAVDSSSQLAGCMILGAHYSPNPNADDKFDLKLQGRVFVEGQIVEIEKLTARLMRTEPAWVQPGRAARSPTAAPAQEALAAVPLQINPDISELQVVRGSGEAARALFINGQQKFWNGDYSAAARDFQFASLESPRAIEYRYWRALADISTGNTDRAYRQMKNVQQMHGIDPHSRNDRQVARSLTRIQGPLRRELSRLEQLAVMNVLVSNQRTSAAGPRASVTMRPRW